MTPGSSPRSWRQDWRECEHGPRIPRWGKSRQGAMWAHFQCPARECDPVWENSPEHVYDAWAAWMQMEIHSGRVAAETVAVLDPGKAAA